MGPYGPGPGPYEGETVQEKNMANIFKNIFVFNANTTLFDSFKVFFRFLIEIRFRTIAKLPQKTSFGTKLSSFGTSITLP